MQKVVKQTNLNMPFNWRFINKIIQKNKKSKRKRILDEYIYRIYTSIGLILSSIVLGIVGFIFIENYTLNEAFYMTIITLSTVGYTEVRPLSELGRIFASFLIIGNLGVFAYSVSVVSASIIEGDFKRIVRNFGMQQKIEKLSNHMIICGFGRYGTEVALQFLQHQIPFVIIEEAEETIKEIRQEKKMIFLKGDATDDEALEEAGIHRAKALITCLPEDADNVYVVLTARQLNPKLHIVSRATKPSVETKLKRAGADHVITPEQVGGFFMATLVGQPDVIEFFRIITNHQKASISFEEIDFEKLSTPYESKTIRELNIRTHTGANVIGLKMPDGEYIVNPSPDTVIQPKMRLIVLGNAEQIECFKNFWKYRIEKGEG